ncbi:hypothetical protein PVAP13_5NG637550 [Panicum virgatum]|uniref:Uncharacterized protein n=1 Tax=Panicum virgatum TaxID=38727 RepID=A0A8T0SCC2_PANVG|nr:hypothetical protein PVAP13_5NG637550 [Panicum virgatum]
MVPSGISWSACTLTLRTTARYAGSFMSSSRSSRSPATTRRGPKCQLSNVEASGRPVAVSIWTAASWSGAAASRQRNSSSCARSVTPRTRPRKSTTDATKEAERGRRWCVHSAAPGLAGGKGREANTCLEQDEEDEVVRGEGGVVVWGMGRREREGEALGAGEGVNEHEEASGADEEDEVAAGRGKESGGGGGGGGERGGDRPPDH